MDWQKPAYIGGIIVLTLAILFEWNQFKEDKALATTDSDSSIVSTINSGDSNASNNAATGSTIPVVPAIEESDLPTTSKNSSQTDTPETANTDSNNLSELIHIKTSTIEMVINLNGGDIVQVVLPKHKVKLNGEKGFTILDQTLATTYIV